MALPAESLPTDRRPIHAGFAGMFLLITCLSCDSNFNDNSLVPQGSTIRITVPDGDAFLSKVDYISDELLVQVIPGSLTDAENLASNVGATLLEFEEKTRSARVRMAPEDLESTATQLARLPEIESVEKNYLLPVAAIPSDPQFPNQWHLSQVGAEGAWDLTHGDANLIIAIVDTGVDVNHPDLKGRLIPGFNFVTGNSDANDCCGHGTGVAGVAAAIGNNGIGVTGITWSGKILPVRVAELVGNEARARSSDIAKGIIWATDQGASVINLSFSGVLHSKMIQNACQYAVRNGASVVAAMGNSGARENVPDSPWIISVSATATDDNLASFSTFGSAVDLAAPGVQLLTTARFGAYQAFSGTSFASPLACGVIALMKSIRPDATPLEIEEILRDTADDAGPAGPDESFGYGIVNASAAVQSAQSASLPDDITPPTVRFSNPPGEVPIGGKIRIEIDAQDNRLIRYVALSVDGIEITRDFSAPYAMMLNPLQPGSAHITTRAVDFAGNTSNESAVDIAFLNNPATPPPEVAITSPETGNTLRGSVTIAANLADAAGLRSVALMLDGEVLASGELAGRAARVEFTWNASSTGVRSGHHIIAVMATSANNLSEIATLDVTTAP